MPSPDLIPAAQYLRMSTERQEYSLRNQADLIALYAKNNGYEIVRTYQDAGRSGVTFKNRLGLQALLKDVLSGSHQYRAILVYDVSRWGRFQDIDEAAYYEFLCRRYGVNVEYCAEPFSNDGMMGSSIIKALKRSMAAEYSRELGVKVFAGKRRIVELGYRVGGEAGLGYRRIRVTAKGKRYKLEEGEYKALTTDRVTLALGPKKEVQFVRDLFEMALHNRFTDVGRFADEAQNLKFHGGKPWGVDIYRILKNPKYTGTLVWNRTTQSLHAGQRKIQPNNWTVVPNAFPAIISQELFDKVQTAHRRRCTKISDEELLKRLRKLYQRKGTLSTQIILSGLRLRSPQTLRKRFGTILRVYELLGFKPSSRAISTSMHLSRTLIARERLMQELIVLFPGRVMPARLPCGRREAIMLDDGTVVRVLFAHRYITRAGLERWEFIPPRGRNPNITLLGLLEEDRTTLRKLYVMPDADLRREYQIKGLGDPWLGNGIELRARLEFYRTVQEIRDRRFEENFQELIEPQWDYFHAEAIRQAAALKRANLKERERQATRQAA